MKRLIHLAISLALSLLFSAFLAPADRSETFKRRTIKILTYNIHHASPPSRPGTTDLDAIARVINEHQPDLVALQEVDAHTGRSGPYHQAEEIGKRTGLTPYFFKSIEYDGGQYGIAILSRYPVTATNVYPLPRMEGNGGEPRILATVTVSLSPKEEILFACTHLDSRRDTVNRRLQMEAITALLNDIQLPVIIAGDFNDVPGSHVINILDQYFTRTCEPCQATFPVGQSEKPIDLIAFKNSPIFSVKQHTVIPESYGSDHFPVLAVLELKK